MKVIWLGGDVNARIAGYLKEKKIIDDYEANTVKTILIINKDQVKITFKDFLEALSRATPKTYPMKELKEIWRGLWLNLSDAKIAELTDDHVILEAKEAKEILSIRIPKTLKQKLEEVAEKENKTITEVVIEALKKTLSQNNK